MGIDAFCLEGIETVHRAEVQDTLFSEIREAKDIKFIGQETDWLDAMRDDAVIKVNRVNRGFHLFQMFSRIAYGYVHSGLPCG